MCGVNPRISPDIGTRVAGKDEISRGYKYNSETGIGGCGCVPWRSGVGFEKQIVIVSYQYKPFFFL